MMDFHYDYNANSISSLVFRSRIELDEAEFCIYCYDRGSMHTLVTLNDDDEFDEKSNYSIKPINIVGTTQRANHFMKTKKIPRMIDVSG